MKEQFLLINFHFPWLFPFLSFVVGSCFGSFMNVCIYRIPQNKSVVFPGSHCSCGKPIAWHDNIPIISWFLLRGKARCCGSSFSFRYTFVEMLTGLVFLACWLLLSPLAAMCGMIFCFMMLASSFIDLDHMIIPDRFSIGGAVVGVILSFVFPDLHGFSEDPWIIESVRGLIESMVGVLVGSGFILWIGLLGSVVFRKEAMGMGDVKFLGAIGAFCGWQGTLFAIFGGAVIGTFSMLLIFIGKTLLQAVGIVRKAESKLEAKTNAAVEGAVELSKNSEGEEQNLDPGGSGHEVPYGPMLAVAAMLYFLYFHKIIDPIFANIKFMIYSL